MLTAENLKSFAKKLQTREQNIVREYIQHLFLSHLYQNKNSTKLLFKGGTALRILYQSPRFSEDIDFTGQHIYSTGEIDNLFLETLAQIEKGGVRISFREAKETTGGYLGVIHYELLDFLEDMKFEVSLRRSKKTSGELTQVVSDFTPPYTLYQLMTSLLVGEKLQAVLTRKKPRDYYDLYFALRHPALRLQMDTKRLKEVGKQLEGEETDFKKELSLFLPASHHLLLKDFKGILGREIRPYL